MTVRRNPITGEPVLYAPERAGRPHAFENGGNGDDARCPFCPGSESDTPPEIVVVGDPWRARVFPNKYPAWSGAEVIVESPRHGETFEAIEHAEDVVRLYADRLRTSRDATYTALFKNEGPRGGASLEHVHSQVVPLPFVPARIRRETAAFEAASACSLCAGVEGETIRESELFSWIVPAASWMPYQQWIVPKRHVQSIAQLGNREIADLALMLRMTAAATRSVTSSCNWCFIDFAAAKAHAYVEILPRIVGIGGLELATGTFVQIVDPVAAAQLLRGSIAGHPTRF